jgi:hypothetical protein
MKSLANIKLAQTIRQKLLEYCEVYKQKTGEYPTIKQFAKVAETPSFGFNLNEMISENYIRRSTLFFAEGAIEGGFREPVRRGEEGKEGKESEARDPALGFEGATKLTPEMRDIVTSGKSPAEFGINIEDFLSKASPDELAVWASKKDKIEAEKQTESENQPEPESQKQPELKPELEPEKSPLGLSFAEPAPVDPRLKDLFDRINAELEKSNAQKTETKTVTAPAETKTVTAPAETKTITAPATETKTVTAPATETKTVTAPATETKTVTAPATETKTVMARAPETKTVMARAPETKTVTAPATETKTVMARAPETKTVMARAPETKTKLKREEEKKEITRIGELLRGKSGEAQSKPAQTTTSSPKDESTPFDPGLGDVRYHALKAMGIVSPEGRQDTVLPVYEEVYSPKKSLKKKAEKQKYKVVVTQEGGKKVEIFAASLRGVKRAVYGKQNYRIFDSKGTDISSYFRKMQKKAK